jgi:hypothetical protein
VNPTRREYAGLCLLVAIVLLSRVPFLNAGYGVQTDGWRVANAARHFSETGDYQVSRFPGYPVHEITCSFLWKGGAVALNGASAFFGAAAVLLFALIARAMGCKDWLLANLALAFTPVFYIDSVSSKDFTWSLAFMLASLFACLKNRPVAAGIFLGLATGCRITSCIAGLPLLIILAGNDRNRALRRVIVFATVSMVTATIMFLPVMLKYGPGFFNTYYHDYPQWRAILEMGVVQVWGWAGIAGLCIALAGIAWKLTRPEAPASLSCARYHAAAWATAVVIYLTMFAFLPDAAGYLIPLIPFVILLLARFSARPAFQAFCVLAMAAPFVTIDHGKIAAGAIFQDHAERVRTSESIANFVGFTGRIPGRNVFVVGSWEPEITNRFPAGDGGNRYAYLLTAQDIVQCVKSGTPIYYNGPTIQYFNLRVYGIDLAKYGGRDIRVIYDRAMKARSEAASKQTQ